ncbi:MAG: DUF2007 domain-containing protein [Bacteroidales bacterium]|nr:DUF2007 domain-containing protein [Bacteroidales bacterium]
MVTSDDLVNIFSGNEIQVLALQHELETEGIGTMIRDDQQAGNLLGIGSIQFSVNLFIEKENLEKATPVLEDFLKRNDITQ